MTYDYFYNNENEQYQFLQMPWLLIKDEQFKTLMSDAKILYSLLLNRTFLSKKNGWIDEQGRVYLIYTVEEIKEDLNCGREKAIKSMQALAKIGLVQTIRRGLGKPNLIYVKNFATSCKYQSNPEKEPESHINTQTSEKPTSGNSKSRLQEVRKADSSNTNSINTNFSNIKSESTSDRNEKVIHNHDIDNELLEINRDKEKEPLISETNHSTETKSSSQSQNAILTEYDYNTYRKILQEKIEYSHYLKYSSADIDLIDELVDCMLDVILTKGETVKINGENKNRQMVTNQYLKINSADIDLIIAKYKEQRHKITHIHNYLKTILYNVKQEQGHYYTNAVRTDRMVQ